MNKEVRANLCVYARATFVHFISYHKEYNATNIVHWKFEGQSWHMHHGPLTRYVKSRVAHTPGMPGTFSPAIEFKGKRELAIPACITERASRTCRDAYRDCLPAVEGKTFPAFPAHAHPQFDVFGKRPILSTHNCSWSILVRSSTICAN